MVAQRKNKKNEIIGKFHACWIKLFPTPLFWPTESTTVKQFALPAQGAVAEDTTTVECYSRQSKNYVNMTSSASNFSNFSGKISRREIVRK